MELLSGEAHPPMSSTLPVHPLPRDPTNNRFRNADLAKILMDATEAPAAAFRARGTSALMKVVEVLGMEQARGWGVCALNEFRKFVGLRRVFLICDLEAWVY